MYARLMPFLSFPMLARELIGRANRKSTYVIRVVYIVLLFFFSSAFFLGSYSYDKVVLLLTGAPMDMVGQGYEMFFYIYVMQMIGVYLFLPQMASFGITKEKERNAIELLMLTDLSPWKIILEKFMASVLAFLPFLFASMPLLAFCYALGGLSSDELIFGVITLTIIILQIAAIGTFSSAWAKNNTQAFVFTYAFSVITYLLPLLCLLLIFLVTQDEYVMMDIADGISWFLGFDDRDHIFYCLFVPAFYFEARYSYGITGLMSFQSLIPSLLVVPFYLIMARVVFIKRATFKAKIPLIIRLFRWIDEKVQGVSKSLNVDSVRFFKKSLPEKWPIAWRDTHRRGIGQAKHVVYMLMFIILPIVFLSIFMMLILDPGEPHFVYFTIIESLAWIIVPLVLIAQSSNTFSMERSKQTLVILSTLPLTSWEIIWQKIVPLMRVSFVLTVLMLTIVVLKYIDLLLFNDLYSDNYSIYIYSQMIDYGMVYYILISLFNMLFFLTAVIWLASATAVVLKGKVKTIVVSFFAVVAWILLPYLVAAILDEFFYMDFPEWIAFISPTSAIVGNISMELHRMVDSSYYYYDDKFTIYSVVYPIWSYFFAVVLILTSAAIAQFSSHRALDRANG